MNEQMRKEILDSLVDESELNIFLRIRERPGLFLGSKSMSLLQAFSQGYFMAKRESVSYDKLRTRFTLEQIMNAWAAQKIKDPGGAAAGTILLEHVDGNEEKVFDLFFELLDEYLERNGG